MIRKVVSAALLIVAAASAMPAAAQSYSELDSAMDSIIAKDSGNWIFYNYDRGSARNSEVVSVSSDGGTYIVRTTFDYQSGPADRVTVRLSSRGVDCVRYQSVSSPCTLGGTPDYKQIRGWLEVADIVLQAASNASDN